MTAPLTLCPDLLALFHAIGSMGAYPAELQQPRRAEFVGRIRQENEPCEATTTEIALNVAAYNVAHVSERNKAWAKQRLQEEQAKAVNCNK